MAVSLDALSDELRRALPVPRTSGPHGGLEQYLGSPVPVLGARVPELRSIVRRFARDHPGFSVADRRRLAGRLWRGPCFEERVLAVMLLARTRAWLDPATWRMICRWPDQATGWGLSDTVSLDLLAPAVAASSARYREVADWARSPNLWRRRAALYAMSRLVRGGDLDRPFRLMDRLINDPERWVQRAVGTWLRECWKQDRARTERYLRRNATRLSAVALTVATERAPRATRAALRALAGRRAPGPVPSRR